MLENPESRVRVSLDDHTDFMNKVVQKKSKNRQDTKCLKINVQQIAFGILHHP
jgi:hypothetical protein